MSRLFTPPTVAGVPDNGRAMVTTFFSAVCERLAAYFERCHHMNGNKWKLVGRSPM